MASPNKTAKLIETMEAYGNRLHFNTILNVTINGIAVFLILKYSTKAMGIYKWYIFMTVICAFIMDFHSCFIYGIFIILPTPISCPTGLVKHFGWFWGTHINYIILHFNMSLCGISIVYSVIYQYISLIKSPEIFKNPKIIAAMFFSMIAYPIPMLSLYIINVDFEAGKTYVIINFPYLSNIYVPKSCNTILVNYTMYAYMISGIIEISAMYFIGIIFFIKINRKLTEIKHSLSAQTLNARKQYFRALLIQATVPLIFIVLPITGIMFSVVIGMVNAEDIFPWVWQLFGLHSSGNALTVIFVIKPYRDAFYQWCKKFVAFFYKTSAVNSTNSTFFVSTTNT